MNFKIDTREKFTMITPYSDLSSDNLTAEFKELIESMLQHKTNIVINLKRVAHVEESTINYLAALQSKFYEENISMVVCAVQPDVFTAIKKLELDDMMNMAKTETEAWDIVQMEEVERELLREDDD